MAAAAAGSPQAPLFTEILPEHSRISWTHDNGMSPAHYLPETLGPGVCFFDYDNDGWLDVFLVNSGPCDFYKPAQPVGNALYRNNRDGTFEDVSKKAGVQAGAFGMGVAAGDYNNDGYVDLFVTGYGGSTLYRNNGNGTFTDVTSQSGIDVSSWATSAVWFDYDADGLLDLFVCSFVDFGLAKHLSCGDNKAGKPFYCIPKVFKPTANYLFHNNGDGTFTNVTSQTEIAKNLGKALGVVATDVNNDRKLDLFVANDTVQNFLFLNRGNKWEEAAVGAGVALSSDGQPRSGMGVDAADFDADGWQDLFVANIDHETFSLYKNNKDESFTDVAFNHDIAKATRLLSGWGLKFFDFDNDGHLDLMLANGHPDDMVDMHTPNVTYREALVLFQQQNGRLHNVSSTAGPIFSKQLAARGLAAGDYDNDGRVDVLVGINGGAPVLLHNNADARNNWVGLHLIGKKCNRDAVGAKITWQVNGVRRSLWKVGGGSYLSSHDPRIVIGIGAATKLDWIEVSWPAPSSRTERFRLPLRTYSTIHEGDGSVI